VDDEDPGFEKQRGHMLTFEKLNAGATSFWWNVFDIDYLKWNLVWRVTRSNRAVAGKFASRIRKGYLTVTFNKKEYPIHRIIYQMLVGEIPNGMMVDHIDGDRSNNAPSNLRLATSGENVRNSRRRRDNQTGIKGLSIFCDKRWPDRKYWKANVQKDGVEYPQLFPYDDLGKESALTYLASTRRRLHKEFANDG